MRNSPVEGLNSHAKAISRAKGRFIKETATLTEKEKGATRLGEPLPNPSKIVKLLR